MSNNKEAKVYTYEDVKDHNKQYDCWIVLFGNVYNITSFLVEHPGGIDILMENATTDATDKFVEKNHTEYAKSLLEPRFLGKYDASKDPADLKERAVKKNLSAMKGKKITPGELAQHNKPDDCWIAVKGRVYDPVPYLMDHPGGPEMITDYAGKDATAAFENQGHSSQAREKLEEFYIGELMTDGKGNELTWAEVAKHNKEDDCWVAIDGKVYNVTNFLNEHPGGPDLITEHAGGDASDDFRKQGHTAYAKGLLKTYYVGDLKKGENEKRPKVVDKKNANTLKPVQIIFLIFGIVAGFLLYQFIKN